MYTALPSSPNFKNVKRESFTSSTPSVRRADPAKKQKTEDILAKVVIDEPPSDSDADEDEAEDSIFV